MKGSRTLKTQQQIEKFTEMWNSNIPRTEIAKEFKICYTHIFWIARNLGLCTNEPFVRGRARAYALRRRMVKRNEVIKVITEMGVCSSKYLNTLFSSFDGLSSMLRELVRNERISMFNLCVGGGRGGHTLFDGICSKRYYYTDKEQASKFIIQTLQLGTDTFQIERKAMTQIFRRTLKPDLFKLVSGSYRKRKRLLSQEHLLSAR